jgi:hypothetical protein
MGPREKDFETVSSDDGLTIQVEMAALMWFVSVPCEQSHGGRGEVLSSDFSN